MEDLDELIDLFSHERSKGLMDIVIEGIKQTNLDDEAKMLHAKATSQILMYIENKDWIEYVESALFNSDLRISTIDMETAGFLISMYGVIVTDKKGLHTDPFSVYENLEENLDKVFNISADEN